jgi:hypothetical protein
MKKKISAALVLIGGAVALGGCTTSGNDAGIETRAHGDRPVYDMPDGYPNLSAVCIKGSLVIVSSTDVAPAVIVHDPTCIGRDGVPPLRLDK